MGESPTDFAEDFPSGHGNHAMRWDMEKSHFKFKDFCNHAAFSVLYKDLTTISLNLPLKDLLTGQFASYP